MKALVQVFYKEVDTVFAKSCTLKNSHRIAPSSNILKSNDVKIEEA